jgi:dCMP deaminase
MDQVPGLIAFLKEMPRPDTDEYYLLQAVIAATRATCPRRRAGAILVDAHNKVISTGYNGVATGLPHCTDLPCPGANQPSGQGLAMCEALHAEENALIQCTRPNDIYTCYSVSSPCIHCLRRLMNTGCRRIVFAEVYPHAECEALWTNTISTISGKREWIHRPWNSLPSIANTVPGRSELGPSSSTERLLDTVTLPLRAVLSPGSKTPSS